MSTRPPHPLRTSARIGLTIGALGVVFGDIGTSPLYTMKVCLEWLGRMPDVSPTDGVLGILSLIFWSLVLVVSVKYLFYVTRADNHGEGGIFALLALIHTSSETKAAEGKKRTSSVAVMLILVGAALLYGDGVITPAISVLGAAEGLEAISPDFTRWVVWIACAILAALFWLQHKGTQRIGRVFGPIMLGWFLALGLLGAWHVMQYPQVVRAIDPRYGLALS